MRVRHDPAILLDKLGTPRSCREPSVETRIQDRTARAKLAVRHKAYWRTLSEGAHLGYRRGPRKGTWMARYFSVERSAYVTSALAEADDVRDADGRDILNYKQAFDAALRWIEIATRGAAATSDPDMTVGDAVRAYIATRDARRSSQAGRALHSDAYYTLTRFVLEDGRLPVLTLAALAEGDLRGWQLRMGAQETVEHPARRQRPQSRAQSRLRTPP